MASMKSVLALCGVWNSLGEGEEERDVVPVNVALLPRNLLSFTPSSTQQHLYEKGTIRRNKDDYYVLMITIFSVLRELL